MGKPPQAILEMIQISSLKVAIHQPLGVWCVRTIVLLSVVCIPLGPLGLQTSRQTPPWSPLGHPGVTLGSFGASSWPISNHLIETVRPPVPTDAGPNRFDQMIRTTAERTNDNVLVQYWCWDHPTRYRRCLVAA